jgi:DNA-binding transcriptional ArsR family regulator
MTTKTRSTKRKTSPDDLTNGLVEEIDAKIEMIDRKLAPYQRWISKRNELMAARRALLGGSRATGGGGTRLQQEDIVGFLRENPGSTPSQLAERFGVPAPTVSSHLYRGKDERFLTKDGMWYLREPKKGINTVDDIEDEDD